MGFLSQMPEEAPWTSALTPCAAPCHLSWKRSHRLIVRYHPFGVTHAHRTRVPGVFAGSVFVSRRARAFLEGWWFLTPLCSQPLIRMQDKLHNSKYGTQDSVDHITKRFDETTKRLFRDKKEPQYVLFGSPLDKDPSAGIRQGQLKLTG